MNFGLKLFPLECTQAKKLTDGRLEHHGRPHVRRTTDISVSPKLTLSKLRWANKTTIARVRLPHPLFMHYMKKLKQKKYTRYMSLMGALLLESLNLETGHISFSSRLLCHIVTMVTIRNTKYFGKGPTAVWVGNLSVFSNKLGKIVKWKCFLFSANGVQN